MLTSKLTVTRFKKVFSQGEVMSVRKALVLLVALSALTFLVACGGGGPAPANAVPPPSGSLGNSTLNGTYVFSISGTDVNGDPISIAGTLTANGSGTITGGAIDINDVGFTAPAANLQVGSSSYNISVDGRGLTQLNLPNNPFGSNNPITLDFVLQDNTHGLVSEFDQNATGSGTIDLQTSGVTPTGSYAFILSGGIVVSSTSVSTLASVGNFAVTSGAIAGSEDFNDGGFAYPSENLSGTIALGPSSTPSTTITTSQFGTQTYDVIAIDATHLKFIEMDPGATLSGDAFSQSSTVVPTGTLAFTLSGEIASAPVAAGGLMVTDGAGNIGTGSNEDVNDAGTASPSPLPFTGTYTTTGGRSVLTLSGFTGGTMYAAYPSSGGLLLLEIDNDGEMSGAAFSQSPSATLASSQGYALNLSGVNGGAQTGQATEVDDIAEFTAASGGTLTGIIDENSIGQTVASIPLTGNYSTPSGGRGTVAANANNGSTGTLEGVLSLTYYTVDGTTFPFIETDSGQVAAGVFVLQSPTGATAGIARHAMFVPHPLFHPHAAKQTKK